MAKKTYIRPESTEMSSFIDNQFILAGSEKLSLPNRDNPNLVDIGYSYIGISIDGSAPKDGADGQDALAKGCGVIGLWDE